MSIAADLREDAAALKRLASRLLTRAAYADCDEARRIAGRLERAAESVELAEADTLVSGIQVDEP